MTDAVEQARQALEDARRAQEAAEEALRAAEERASQVAPAGQSAQEPAEASAVTGPLPEPAVAAVQQGYAFEGLALEMGALMNGEARPDVPVRIPMRMLNRHGLVAGATGTGKTKTLQGLAEQLASAGVPVFAADIKGDLTGMQTPGAVSDKLLARTAGIGQNWQPKAFPVEYFSLGGAGHGVPIRATVTGFGPLLLAKVLGLNNTQESSLSLVFAYADKQGLPLVDLKDLRELLMFLTSDAGKTELRNLGGISTATAGVILRELTAFAEAGAERFFGEPEIEVSEFLRTTADGQGVVSLLEVPEVANQPQVFSTFLMWLLGELFESLPEVGDPDKPKLVFFFDEAHLLFREASKDFLAAITQTVRLIRSKGVGVFFVTQTPKDVPDDVLAQLGSRVQHQLRAHTPDAERSLRATVRTYPKSEYDLQQVLTQLGIGEAIVTVMNEQGAPAPVAWTRLRAPEASMDPTPDAEVAALVQRSPLLPKYATAVDRESAYEMLRARLREAESVQAAEDAEAARQVRQSTRARGTRRSSGSGNIVVDAINSRTGQSVIREIVRGILGTRRR